MSPGRLAAMAAVLLLAFLWTPAAQGQSSECQGVINGQPLVGKGTTVTIPESKVVTYSFEAPKPVTSYRVWMPFGGGETTLTEGTVTNGAFEVNGTTDLSSYSRFGGGRYNVNARIVLNDGTSCDFQADLKVEESPFTTAAGWISIILTVGGIAMVMTGGVVKSKQALAAALERKRMAEGRKPPRGPGGAPPGGAPPRGPGQRPTGGQPQRRGAPAARRPGGQRPPSQRPSGDRPAGGERPSGGGHPHPPRDEPWEPEEPRKRDDEGSDER